MFDTSQSSALSLLDGSYYGWEDQYVDSDETIEDELEYYQSLLCTSLLGRITNTLQRLQFLAEDKRSAVRAGSEDHAVLEVVLWDEEVALTSLQSFLDDLAHDYIGPSGMMALQVLLDARYEEDSNACLSVWQPEVSRVALAWKRLHSTAFTTTNRPVISIFAPIVATFKKRFNRTWNLK